jgi:hypothetical protein
MSNWVDKVFESIYGESKELFLQEVHTTERKVEARRAARTEVKKVSDLRLNYVRGQLEALRQRNGH